MKDGKWETVIIHVSTENYSRAMDNSPQVLEIEPDIVSGDVKADNQSSRSAATEQRNVVRDEIVRGNLKETLQSLKKSSINISKGDFEAAMLFRESGQSYTESRMANDSVACKQSFVNLPSSDNQLSFSVSVTGSEHLTISALNSESVSSDADCSKLSKPFSGRDKHPPPMHLKTGNQVKDQKPIIPPKPLHITTSSNHITETPHICPSSPEHLSNKQHTPAIPPKVAPSKTSLHKNETLNQIKEKPCHIPEPVQRTNLTDPTDFQKMQYTEQWVQNSHMQHTDTPSVSKTVSLDDESFACNREGMEKNVIQRINAAEEIRMCMQSYSKDDGELNKGFKVALQNFGEKTTTSVFPKKIKVVQKETIQEQAKTSKENTNKAELHSTSRDTPEMCDVPSQNQVVLREKKARRETEDERRQRLSVHKDEIMRGNVKAAMEIFENLMRREELKIILSKVQEIEGETCEVDVKSLTTLFENVPAWISKPVKNMKRRHCPRAGTETEGLRDDVESISSVESAFEDLEKASMDIISLKEQTLAKLLEIEEVIKKALYSVSNLKSEADIAGLSGLFSESLNASNVSPNTKNIRKISIVSSKAKPVQSKQVQSTDNRCLPKEVPHVHQMSKPCSNVPCSPSFISIHSAARKPAESPASLQPHSDILKAADQPDASSIFRQSSPDKSSASHVCTPPSPKRKVSILEVQRIPEVASGIIGTKTVSEKYEEIDCFGNTYFSSKRSTFVTRQSEGELSASYDKITNPGRYEEMASPVSQHSGQTFSSNSLSKSKDRKVFVTFSHPNTEKH